MIHLGIARISRRGKYGGEASIKVKVVHNALRTLETCLYLTDLYGQNKIISTKYFLLLGASAPPYLNMALPKKIITHSIKIQCVNAFKY